MIISVASGKGGTGKTTVATSLALALSEEMQVQFLDCDVEEPNAHIFLRPAYLKEETAEVMVPRIDVSKCNCCGKCAEVCQFGALGVFKQEIVFFPELCHSCGGCIIFCPEQAISQSRIEIGYLRFGVSNKITFVSGSLKVGTPLSPPLIKYVKKRASNDVDVTIIDAPPGTSCPAIHSIMGSDYCLLVTEPTPFGLHDLELAVGVVRKLGVKAGVVINRWGIGDDRVEDFCRQSNIPILLKIPFDRKIAAAYAEGYPLVDVNPEGTKIFRELGHKILRGKKNERIVSH